MKKLYKRSALIIAHRRSDDKSVCVLSSSSFSLTLHFYSFNIDNI